MIIRVRTIPLLNQHFCLSFRMNNLVLVNTCRFLAWISCELDVGILPIRASKEIAAEGDCIGNLGEAEDDDSSLDGEGSC